MSVSTLKHLRLIVPGFIIIIFAALLGWITGLWHISVPQNLNDAVYDFSIILAAGTYYLTPFRDWANRKFFNDVSENLRSQLVRISGLADDPQMYTWTALRGIFYHFVDMDNSLKVKARLAYSNGLIWTSLADIRALAFFYAFVALALWILRVESALIAVAVFLVVAVLSYWGSAMVTRRHKEIGNQQIEIIEHVHKQDLRTMMEAVRARAHGGSN